MSSPISAEDDEFVRRFYRGEIPNDGFHHRDHLRLAWVQVGRLGFERTADTLTHSIRAFALHHGGGARYNDTMTRFWLRAVELATRRHPELGFEALLAAEPHLLDKSLPFRHWSKDVMNGEEARKQWVEPDTHPLP